MLYDKDMNAAKVLAKSTITAQTTLGIDREAAFDLALAAMINQDPETMKRLLVAARREYESEMSK